MIRFAGMDARPGDVLAGKFRVERTIGSGGMGTVVEATDVVLGRKVAIKITHDALAVDPSAAARFLREARSMAALRGAGFVRVFEIGTLEGRRGLENGAPFIVMELLEGEDLRSRFLRGGPLPLPELVDLFAQACEALAEAHATGLVHRDIKPSNLFVEKTPDGRPLIRVLDLGISKPADDADAESLTASSGTLGSPRYMSPEQALDPRNVDMRSDIWSLGVSLYELWTGKPPFEGPSHLQLCKAILEKKPPAPSALRPGTPRAFEALMLRCLEKRPEDRFADVAELAEALAKLDPSASQRAVAARAFCNRRPSPPREAEQTGTDTAVDAKGQTHEETETSMPVSRTSIEPFAPVPARWVTALAGIAIAGMLGTAALYALTRDDGAAGAAARLPSAFASAKRTLVHSAAAQRDVGSPPSAEPAAPPKTHTRTNAAVRQPGHEDDPLSSSH